MYKTLSIMFANKESGIDEGDVVEVPNYQFLTLHYTTKPLDKQIEPGYV
jgi:hypothetical protein